MDASVSALDIAVEVELATTKRKSAVAIANVTLTGEEQGKSIRH